MSTNTSEYLLEVKDLHTSFFTDSGEVKAVNGVSFTLKPGEIMGIWQIPEELPVDRCYTEERIWRPMTIRKWQAFVENAVVSFSRTR